MLDKFEQTYYIRHFETLAFRSANISVDAHVWMKLHEDYGWRGNGAVA